MAKVEFDPTGPSRMGNTLEAIGVTTAVVSGLLNQLYISAGGGAVFLVGLGINHLSKRNQGTGNQEQPKIS
jgi:hypothetical protein